MASGAVEGRKPIGFKPIAPDGGYGWFVVLCSLLILVIVNMFFFALGEFKRKLNAEASILRFLDFGLILATGPTASDLCNRIGYRTTIIIGAVIASFGWAILSMGNLTEVKITFFSIGIVCIGFGLMYFPAIVIVIMYFERRRVRATVFTIWGAAIVSSYLSPYQTIYLFGGRIVLIIYAVVTSLCALFALYAYRPIEFEPIYADDAKKSNDVTIANETHDNQPIAKEDKNLESQAISSSRVIENSRMRGKMFDLSLYADPVYLLFSISFFLTNIGYNTPLNHRILYGENTEMLNLPRTATSVIYVIASIFGLIVFFLVCNSAFPFKYGKDRARNRLCLYSWSLMIIGVASVFIFLGQFSSLGVSKLASASYLFVCAIAVSFYTYLTPVILVELVGVDRFTNAFGLLLLVQGIEYFIGPYFCGKIDAITENLYWTYAFCGVCLFLSGIMLSFIPFMKKTRNDVRLETPAEKHSERPILHKFVHESVP